MSVVEGEVVYPDSDGEPMADNTLQFEWIVTIKGGLDALFADRDDVFVAGDLLWYPVRGDNRTRMAPDALVAFGRPKGYRGSYRQWEEGGVAPQVVFEILSPGNRAGEMSRKFDFYEQYGVEEYYIYDPDSFAFSGWVRRDGRLRLVEFDTEWTSPLLGVRFVAAPDRELVIFNPDGSRFLTFLESEQQRRDAEQRVASARQEAASARQEAESARQKADAAQSSAEAARQEADAERAAKERLAARLRELGINPDDLA